MLEQAVRARIESVAARHGLVARIGLVHVGVWPLLRLEGCDLDLGHGVRLHADTIAATWPGRLRLAVRAAALAGPAGVRVGSAATVWDVAGIFGDDLRLRLVEPQAGLSIRKLADPVASAWNIEARGLDVGRLLGVRRDVHPLLDGGLADGRVDLQASTDALRFHVDMGARGTRLGALADNAAEEPQLGDPTDVTIRFDGAWRRGGTIEIPDVHATVAGAALSGSIALRDLDTDPVVDLALGVRQLDFAQLLGTSGLAVPESLGMAPGGGRDLGSATIEVRVRGRPADPASLSVSQKIEFRPPRQMPPAIGSLRGDFIFTPEDGPGPHRPIDVSPASPDFIALRDVPPLFVRTLLLAEDAGFYGHRGIDLRELPAALLTNWSRGGAARGASTITQQLAKNLFLSRDKQLGRKLQELAITFLLESALGKDRILEIYLNIIEWGPDLRGLRPAARHYFACEPQELTPAQMAFLVAIIPGPIKYQSSFAHGTPGPGLRSLIDELLAKLRSVDAIGEEEYQRALGEPLFVVGGRRPDDGLSR
ncbi:MAG TPA: biosynthetic peptidoglycan transglycosylase [Steroidobacteraceae bacterium]|nr:biosynthetic peptidoglycan transglycosylase [Steroidobacteraceae bacterium]